MWRLKIFARFKALPLKAWVSLAGLGLLVLLVVALALVTKIPARIMLVKPSPATLTAGVTIRLSHPISRDRLTANIQPVIEGEWVWQPNWLGNNFIQTGSFVPDAGWPEGQQYTLSFQQTPSGATSAPPTEQKIAFTAPTLPKIMSASVTDGQVNVGANSVVTVSLDQPNNNVVDYGFRFEPTVDFSQALTADKKGYSLRPTSGFAQGQTYQLVITKQVGAAEPTEIRRVKFQTAFPPGIASYAPQGNSVLATTSEIKIVFSNPMVQSEVLAHLTLTPAVSGGWRWLDDKTVAFAASEKLALATTYTVKLGAGVHAQSGSVTDAETRVSFSTLGRVKVSAFSPANKASGRPLGSPIHVTFDQAVDQASAESLFVFEPSTAGSFSWSGNQLAWQPTAALSYNSSYRVTIKAGVKSVNGLNSDQAFSAQFTTVEQVVLLNVAPDHQDKALSCEAAALKMALGYHGVHVSEDDIMNTVGYDPTIRDGSRWGDPNQAFVGNINGSQNSTGYGVYWNPIARAARSWRNAEAFSGWSVSQLAATVNAGNPVVIWGTFGRGVADSWQTPGGATIQAWKGEHTRVVIGFKGSLSNPTSFILNDPISGRISWSTSQLTANWSSFNNSGVAVY